MKIKFAKLYEDVKLPSKRDEDAGFDIYAYFDEKEVILLPHKTFMFKTGLVSSFSDKYVAIIKERGSTGVRGIGQRSGVVDSGYRGEWLILVTNHNDIPLIVTKNPLEHNDANVIVYPYEKAICQCLILELPKVEIEVVTSNEIQCIESNRGGGKLGSSGK